MSQTRSFLFFALCAIGFLLWQAWDKDYGSHSGAAAAPTPVTEQATAPVAGASIADVPSASQASALVPVPPAGSERTASTPTTANTPPITVRTDVLEVEIDTAGGTLSRVALSKYPQTPKAVNDPVVLISSDPANWYVAQSGLVSSTAPAPDHNARFESTASSYELQGDAQELSVPLTWRGADGVLVTKIWKFKRGSYEIALQQEVRNDGDKTWTGSAYRQLQRKAPVKKSGFSLTSPESYSFVGAAWYSPEQHFEKLPFDNFIKEPHQREIADGWAAMLQHYFFTAWIPPAGEKDTYSTAVVGPVDAPHYLVRQVSPAISVAPGASGSFDARLYVGPKLQTSLAAIAPGLERTVDYGKVTVIAEPLFHYVLNPIHSLVKNWGWAIVLTTMLLKLVLFPLSESQYRSMAKMKALQPRLEALKARYGDDREKLNQAMIEFYKKEKVNPAGGCLPILIQMPIFIALYWVLIESVELRQAPFMGWIQNLSAQDPYYVLPVINAAVMFITQRLSPTTGMDPTQQKMMQMMPIVFSFMFAFFPAGLVLYWAVNGLLSLGQQWLILRRYEKVQAKR